jgi:hypothetical protein
MKCNCVYFKIVINPDESEAVIALAHNEFSERHRKSEVIYLLAIRALQV